MVAESWTWDEEKAFEDAVAVHWDAGGDWLEKVAVAVTGKTLEDVRNHYQILVDDVTSIESGRVPPPNYVSPSSSSSVNTDEPGDCGGNRKKGGHSRGDSVQRGKGSRSDLERRKGIAWTEEEHRLFLLGLEKYGKGDWRSISRKFVISRTPTQVASHAQKYFIRLNSMNKERRRSSIHDITRVNNCDVAVPHGPITGLGVGPAKASKQPSHIQSAPGIGLYHAAIGQPVAGPPGQAVGTPVAGPPLGYGIPPLPVAGLVVTSGHVRPMAYMIPNSSSQR
uniref:Transcription factor MYBS1 n=1 Tax=Orchis italica TaxID=59334 RepID=A0A1Y0KLB6_9ASPA|nr:DIVARICATA-like [Orchis italica]